MDKISRNVFLLILIRVNSKCLYRLSNVGLKLDETFYKKYCVLRKIVLTTYPWISKLILWENRQPILTTLDEYWDDSFQQLNYMWGYDDNCVIEYQSNEYVLNKVINHVSFLLSEKKSISIVNPTGYYFLKQGICKNSKELTTFFLHYCAYDQLQVGYCINNKIIIDECTYYNGETLCGLRQGYGIMIFDSGFIIDSDMFDGKWNDYNILEINKFRTQPMLLAYDVTFMSNILDSFITWASNVHKL